MGHISNGEESVTLTIVQETMDFLSDVTGHSIMTSAEATQAKLAKTKKQSGRQDKKKASKDVKEGGQEMKTDARSVKALKALQASRVHIKNGTN